MSIPNKYKHDKLLWLTETRQDLVEKHRGQWVVLDIDHNKVFADDVLERAIGEFRKEHPNAMPSIFLIPAKEEEHCVYGISLQTNR